MKNLLAALCAAFFMLVASAANAGSPTVRIDGSRGGHGTAVHLGDGLFITAAHVVRIRTDNDTFSLSVDNQSIQVERVYENQAADIAFVKVAGLIDFTSASVQCKGNATIGLHIRHEGFPQARAFQVYYGRVGSDVISAAVVGRIGAPDLTQAVDVMMSMGSSGGGIFLDDKGNTLVGMISGWIGSENSQGIALMIPALPICDALAAYETMP